MTESAWHRQPPQSMGPIASAIMDGKHLSIDGPNPEPYLESELLTTEPPKNWSRSILFSLNLCLVVLFAIFVILAIGAIRTVKEDREEKVQTEFCERWEQDYPTLPTPENCR